MPWPSLLAAALVLPAQGLAVWLALTASPVSPSGVGLLPAHKHPLVIVPAQLALLAIPLVGAALSPVPLRERLGLVGQLAWRPVLGALACTLAVTQVVIFAACLLRPDVLVDLSILRERAVPVTPALSLLTVLAGSLLPALSEELLYRGFLLRGLLRSWRPGLAIGTSAALFALAHGVDAALAPRFVVGLVLGVAAWRSGSLWPGMVAHFFANFTFLGWSVWIPFPWASTLSPAGHLAGLILSMLTFVFGLLALVGPRYSPPWPRRSSSPC